MRDPAGITRAVADGIIAYSVATDNPVLAVVRSRGLPLVVIDQPRLPNVPWIGIDDEQAAYEAARHVVNLGHRRIGIISFALSRERDDRIFDLASIPETSYEVTARRFKGYARALDMTPDPIGAWVIGAGGSREGDGAEAAERLLRQTPRPTALLCLSA